MTAEPAARRDQTPDLIEPVVGFRRWRLRGGQLVSPWIDVAWGDSSLRAECLPRPYLYGVHQARPERPHGAPDPGCVCGIYAAYEPDELSWSLGDPHMVTGAVVVWGRVELHADGMRAAHARAVAVALPSRLSRLDPAGVGDAAGALGLDVVHRLEELWGAARRHGSPLPDGLRHGLISQ